MPDQVTEDADIRAEGEAEDALPVKAGQPETLTLAQVQALLEEQKRGFQSVLDKREARLMQRLQQDGKVKELATKHNVSPEALAELRGAFSPPEEAAEPEAQREPNRKQAPDLTPEAINSKANEIAAKYQLAADDPEVEYIITDGSPEDYLASIRAAGIAKSVRLKQTQSSRPARSPSLMPSGGNANGKKDFSKMSEGDLLRAGADKVRRGQ